jgi:hypothetical protein
MLFLTMTAVAVAQTNETETTETNAVVRVRVTGDRVSLRATPALDGSLLESAMLGDELLYLTQTNEWIGVQAPDILDYWVASKYVKNGVVQPDRLNVRAGPSLNYAKLAELSAGDAIVLRGEFNGWLKIAPPAGSCVWINEAYVEVLYPPTPESNQSEALVKEPVKPADESATGSPPMDGEIVAEPDRLPSVMLVLDESRKQGDYVELPGVLRRANPGLYKLVLIDSGFEEPICLVRGRESQMERYLNRSMLIKGKRYWAKDVELPVIQPEKIHLDPLLVD